MKSLLKRHCTNVLDGIKVRLVQLQPFCARMQKTASLYLLRFVVVVAVVMIALWLVKSTWLYFINQRMFLVGPETFTFDTPTWVTDRLIERLRNVDGLKTRYNIFEKT